MQPTHKCPDDRAEYIGSTTFAEGTFDYWVHTFRDIGEIYLFCVDDDSGSFATITLSYTKDGSEPQRRSMCDETYWKASSDCGDRLCMTAPSSGWYGGMHAIAFNWLWKSLYTSSMRGCAVKVHSESDHNRNQFWLIERKLRKAGIPLTDAQMELLLPTDDW